MKLPFKPLRELQAEFLELVMFPGEGQYSEDLMKDASSSGSRVLIYHNNMYGNLRGVLRSIYPVVENLVDEEFFTYAANKYIQQHPSSSGDLNLYGGQFPAFLAGFPAVSRLDYLPDTASLEWLVHQVYFSADSLPLDLQALVAVPSDNYGNMIFMLNPACRLYSSIFPVHLIWQANQPGVDDDHTVDISGGGVNLVVIRQERKVTLQTVTHEEYRLLKLIGQKVSFSTLCQQVLDSKAALDMALFLNEFINRRVIGDYSVGT